MNEHKINVSVVKKIRRKHLASFIFLSVFLPIVAGLALYFKVDLNQDSPKTHSHSLDDLGDIVFDSSQKKASAKNMDVKIFKRKSNGKGYAIFLEPKRSFQRPDSLVYLSRYSLKKSKKPRKKLAQSTLLGEFIDGKGHLFMVDSKNIKKAKYLVFYSGAFSKVFEEIKIK